MDRVTRRSNRSACIASTSKRASRFGRTNTTVPTGRWRYPAGPRACVTIDGARRMPWARPAACMCSTPTTAKSLWQKDLDAEYTINLPIWGISAAPLVVGDLVILHIGGEGACIVALQQEYRQRSLEGLERSGSVLGADHRAASRPAGRDLLDRRQRGGAGRRDGQSPVALRLEAAEHADWRRHAGRREGPRVLHLVLRWLADAAAAPRQAGHRKALADHGPRREEHRRPAFDHQHAGVRQRLYLRRR